MCQAETFWGQTKDLEGENGIFHVLCRAGSGSGTSLSPLLTFLKCNISLSSAVYHDLFYI